MAVTEQIKKTIEGIRHQFPTEQALLLPMLHEVQDSCGWVSMDDMRAIGEYLNLPLSKVREVASFYTMYKLEPQGKVDIQICTNISCWLNGSDDLMSCAERKLGIKCGETTSDGKFTLSHVECLAACGTAPAIMLNEDYFESLDAPKLEKLLDQAASDLAANKIVGRSTRVDGVWP
jgi:NADH-quinone oxidoreductase subunit E